MPRAIKSVLIANRGEIALRIIRTCRRLSLRSVVICSEVDQFHPHTLSADEKIVLGATPREAYLAPQMIVEAALRAGVDAVHPGYGYLSESAEFAESVEQAGLKFIGPTPETLRLFGEKHRARELAATLQIPISPGFYEREIREAAFLEQARTLGFPLIVKAVSGGGGRGMRLVDSDAELAPALESARAEALRAFGDERLLVERLVRNARHVEVQLLGDGVGTVLHFGDRDCSLQRRYQKIIEEAPAPGLEPALRAALHDAAVRLGEAAKLRSAATVEFLVLNEAEAATFGTPYLFLEANCRIQVEHPVTEEVASIDLVAEQIAVASGAGLSRGQSQIEIHGHAVEVRLYAEDPAHDFAPQTGVLHSVCIPVANNLRIDHVLYSGGRVLADFDPMIAKVVGSGECREEAIASVVSALDGLSMQGVETNGLFLRDVLHSREFRAGGFSTSLLPSLMNRLRSSQCAHLDIVACVVGWSEAVGFRVAEDPIFGNGRMRAGASRVLRPRSRYRLRASLGTHDIVITVVGFDPARQVLSLEVDTRPIECTLLQSGLMGVKGSECAFRVRASSFGHEGRPLCRVELDDVVFDVFRLREVAVLDAGSLDRHPVVVTHLPGKILQVVVRAGDVLEPGAIVCTIDSMKMEHQICAVESGVVEEVFVAPGSSVSAGQEVVRFIRAQESVR